MSTTKKYWKDITGGFTAIGKAFEATDMVAEAQKQQAKHYLDKTNDITQLLKNLEKLGRYLGQHNKQLANAGVPRGLHLDISRIKEIVTNKDP